MQKYALSPNGHLIFVAYAQKKSSYFCPSCHTPMRVRQGPNRMRHFYHLNSQTCHTSLPTSPQHKQVQERILRLLVSEGAHREAPFPSIGRIADIALPSQKIIFEVQCSPISKKEVERRIFDYGSLGYKVVWILHDQTFNRTFLSSSERYLLSQPHYYTNIDQEGKGIIYDHFALHRGKCWLYKGKRLPVHLSHLNRSLEKIKYQGELGYQLKLRRKKWALSFQGDLYSQANSTEVQKENRPRTLYNKFLEIKEFSLHFTQFWKGLIPTSISQCSKKKHHKGPKSRAHFL